MHVAQSSDKSLANFLFSLQRAVRICVVVAGVLFSIAPSCADGASRVYTGPSTGGVFHDDNTWSLNSPGDNPAPDVLNDFAFFNSSTDVAMTAMFAVGLISCGTAFRRRVR
jgi:hypothetical protein